MKSFQETSDKSQTSHLRVERPDISQYDNISNFISDMVKFRRQAIPGFSVTKHLKKYDDCSPALVTRVASGSRRLTRDKVNTFSSLMGLNRQETLYLDKWCSAKHLPRNQYKIPQINKPRNNLFNDWAHAYVKDAFHLRNFRPDPEWIHRILGHFISLPRIKKSLEFLLREGFVRRTPEGNLVLQNFDEETTDDISNKHIRSFHKQALNIARQGIDLYSPEERRADAYVLAVNEENLKKLKTLLSECMDQVVNFRQEHPNDNEKLYQVIMHLTPISKESAQ